MRQGRRMVDRRWILDLKCACAVTKKTLRCISGDGSVTVLVLFRRRRILTSWRSVALFWPPLWLERDPILTKRDKNVASMRHFFVSFPSPYLGAKKEREKKEESSCDQNSSAIACFLQRIIAIVLYNISRAVIEAYPKSYEFCFRARVENSIYRSRSKIIVRMWNLVTLFHFCQLCLFY